MSTFQQLCDVLELKPSEHRGFYTQLKSCLTSWKAKSLWTKLDKRAAQKEYRKGRCCSNTRVSRSDGIFLLFIYHGLELIIILFYEGAGTCVY